MPALRRRKKCPDCAERVAAAAMVCRYCGYRFPGEPAAPATPQSPAPKRAAKSEAQAPAKPAPPRSTATATEAESEEAMAKLGPPKSINGWAVAAYIGLIAIALATALVGVTDLDHLDVLDKDESGQLTQAAYEDSFDKVRASGWYYLGAYVGGGILFICFFFAAYTNIARLGGRGLRFPFGQAFWPWFIPIFNLIRPKQVANDIWRGSHSLDLREQRAWREAEVSPLVHWWWALYLLGGVGAQITTRMWLNAETLDQERSALKTELPFLAVELLGLALAFVFVFQVAGAQKRLIEAHS